MKKSPSSPRWTKSQQSEIAALQSRKWWPFMRADVKVLAHLHKQSQPNKQTDAPAAPF
jgi:hypothetical protein